MIGKLCIGSSSFTEDMEYIYSSEAVISHKKELLDLCKFLPKLKAVAYKSAGTISYLDLLSDTSDHETFKKQCIVADHFVNLLSIAGISLPRKFSKDGIFFTDSEIAEKYKNHINEPKVPSEPDEK